MIPTVMTLFRLLILVACLPAIAGCGLKAPLLLPAGSAASAPRTDTVPPASDAPLCAGGTTNASVQGVCQ